MSNVFTEDLDSFVDRLVELNYYQFFGGAMLERANASIARDIEKIEKNGWKKGWYSFASGVSIADIFHQGDYVIRCPAKFHSTGADDLHRMSEEIERQFNAYMVVLLFEAIETFMRSAYGKFLAAMGVAIKLNETEAFHKAFTGWESRSGTVEYLSKYAQFVCRRDCETALDDFKLYLDWDRARITGSFGMPYLDFIRVLGVCRHCIVHNHGRISRDRLNSLSAEQKAFIDLWFWKTVHGKEKLLLPPTKLLDRLFEPIASYGRGLYVLLSERCGMRDDTPYFNAKNASDDNFEVLPD